MDEQAMERAITRIAHEIIEHNEGSENIQVIGIIRRGETLANRLASEIEKIEGKRPPVGSLDISFSPRRCQCYIQPVVRHQHRRIDSKDIILVDDVLYTGRTVRSALDALMDWRPGPSACRDGRPRPPRAALSR